MDESDTRQPPSTEHVARSGVFYLCRSNKATSHRIKSAEARTSIVVSNPLGTSLNAAGISLILPTAGGNGRCS